MNAFEPLGLYLDLYTTELFLKLITHTLWTLLLYLRILVGCDQAANRTHIIQRITAVLRLKWFRY